MGKEVEVKKHTIDRWDEKRIKKKKKRKKDRWDEAPMMMMTMVFKNKKKHIYDNSQGPF